MPLFSASSTPSENASICTTRLKLVAIFITSARPLSPTWVTFGPMSSSTGFDAFERLAAAPDHHRKLARCSVMTLPETGASTMSAPLSRTRAASPRLTAGLTVLISIRSFLAPALR